MAANAKLSWNFNHRRDSAGDSLHIAGCPIQSMIVECRTSQLGCARYINTGKSTAAASRSYTHDRAKRHEDNAMAKGYFVVRAEVPAEADRAPFDDWYASDHLPLAIKTFAAQRGWRCWSRSDPAVHCAFYEFADVGQAQALINSEKIKPLIADFDRVWGSRVSRRREILEIVQEMTP